MTAKVQSVKVSFKETCLTIDQAIRHLRIARLRGIDGHVDLIVYDLVAEREIHEDES